MKMSNEFVNTKLSDLFGDIQIRVLYLICVVAL